VSWAVQARRERSLLDHHPVTSGPQLTLGALHDSDDRTTRFRVWAPRAVRVELVLLAAEERAVEIAPEERIVEMEAEREGPDGGGYFAAAVEGVRPGALYVFRLHREDGETVERPDPASRFQPRGVHGPSAVIDRGHPWEDGEWRGVTQDELVFYELHVGTFSAEGTFAGVVAHLDELVDLGVTAVELMPVAQFPGERNWGYDGVYPFAVQCSYGGPAGLKRLVDAAHRRGLAVFLDVVYNHMGPEGNYLADFGPYFTEVYATPWGQGLNFDGPDSDAVRRFFVESAVHWIVEHRLDGLRLDAVHAIFDNSERPFLAELTEAVHDAADRCGRRATVVAESAVNTLRFLRPAEHGGCGMDAQWSDDFHHALHASLTGEDAAYYRDFGRLEQLAKAYRDGFVYTGQRSAFRRRRHGMDAAEIPARRFVVFGQNHDQTGNRMRGERLAALVPFEALKLAAGAVLLAPYLPLLFMGEEHGEEAPFLYFVSHSDPELVEAVRHGRTEEFGAFGWTGEVPDPQAEDTFERSRLDRGLGERPENAALRKLYHELLRLRREVPALARLANRDLEAATEEGVLRIERRAEGSRAVAWMNFTGEPRRSKPLEGGWRVALDSAAARWHGPKGGDEPAEPVEEGTRLDLAPRSFVLLL